MQVINKQTFHLIQWNDSHSCFEIIGCFDQKGAIDKMNFVKQHPNYNGQQLEIISDYQLGYLTAIS